MSSRPGTHPIPQGTCPLCGVRALQTSVGASGQTVVACQSCNSQLVLDPATRRSRYLYVAPQYASIAGALTTRWLTRSEQFALRAASFHTPIQTPGAPSLVSAAPASHNVFWLILFGALFVATLVCACSAALLLGPSMTQTRQQIAAAGTSASLPAPAGVISGQTPSPTETMSVTATVTVPATGDVAAPPTPIDALNSPIAIAASPTAVLVTVAAPTQPVIPTRLPPTAPPVGPTTPPPAVNTPVLPPTFTPVPMPTLTAAVPIPTSPPPLTVAPGITATPAVSLTPTVTATVLPATAIPVTATVIPGSPTITPTITPTSLPPSSVVTGTIAISQVEFLGEDPNNPATAYVELINVASQPVSMNNWTLRVASTSSLFTFGNGFLMLPTQTCRVYVNWPIPYGTCGTLSFGLSLPPFHKEGDMVELRDASDGVIARYLYGAYP